jgi:hypothetical protein
MKRKGFYILTLAGLLFANGLRSHGQSDSTSSNKSSGRQKSAYTEYLKHKNSFEELYRVCSKCVNDVRNDSLKGSDYLLLEAEIKLAESDISNISGKIDALQKKYNAAAKILQDEVERNPYNDKNERKEYLSKKKKLLEEMKNEIEELRNERDESYTELAEKYENTSKKQKEFYKDIIDRRVNKVIDEEKLVKGGSTSSSSSAANSRASNATRAAAELDSATQAEIAKYDAIEILAKKRIATQFGVPENFTEIYNERVVFKPKQYGPDKRGNYETRKVAEIVNDGLKYPEAIKAYKDLVGKMIQEKQAVGK